jgi:uncharacterized protein
MKTRLIILFVVLAGLSGLSAQLKDNVLKVQGEAIVFETPENMNIDIPLNVKDNNYAKCAKLLNERYAKLVQEFGKINIDKSLVQTSNFSINESYVFDNNEQKFDGYVGSININIEKVFNTNVLNSIINLLTSGDFKLSYTVSFDLSPQQRDKLSKMTIENAIADAENKANLIVKQLDVRLGEIKEINFNFPSTTISPTLSESVILSRASSEKGSGIQLTPQLQQIRETIDIIWQIEKAQ